MDVVSCQFCQTKLKCTDEYIVVSTMDNPINSKAFPLCIVIRVNNTTRSESYTEHCLWRRTDAVGGWCQVHHGVIRIFRVVSRWHSNELISQYQQPNLNEKTILLCQKEEQFLLQPPTKTHEALHGS